MRYVFSSLCLTETSPWLVEAFSREEARVESRNIHLTAHHRGCECIVRSVTLQLTLHEAIVMIAENRVVWSTLLKVLWGSLNGAAGNHITRALLLFLQEIC